MSDGFQLLDLLILLAIAVFFVSRLRKVLGRTIDDGKSGKPSINKRYTTTDDGKIVRLNDGGAAASEIDDAPILADIANPDVSKELLAIKGVEPDFSVREFLGGAKLAFEMIVEAFAKGDKAALRPLLGDEIFADFEEAIGARKKAQKQVETTLVAIQSADITNAELKGKTMEITVQFVSEQIAVTRDKEGNIVEGDASKSHLVTDEWTFARQVRSPNPNWQLVAT